MSAAGEESFCGESPLWNLTLLVNSSWPQFTQCFQSSVLVFLPNGFLWCSLLIYLPYILTRPALPPLPSTWSNAAKTVLSVLLSLCTIIAILTETNVGDDAKVPYSTAHYVARFIEGVTYLLAAVLTQIERCRGVITSGVLFIYWLMLAVLDVIPLYSYILLDFFNQDLTRVIIFIVSYVIILIQLVLQAAWADIPRDYAPGACPETSTTFLSRITFWWMTRLITSGFRKPLESGDLWRLNPRDESATVVPRLEEELRKAGAYSDYREFSVSNGQPTGQSSSETSFSSRNNNGNSEGSNELNEESAPLLGSSKCMVSYSSTGRKRRDREHEAMVRQVPQFSLLRVMIRTYCGDVLLSYVCKFCSDLCQYLGPLLLGFLINEIQSPLNQEWKGYVVAGLMLGASWSQTSFYHQHYHIAMTTGMRMKTALMAAVYKKSLRLSTDGQRAGTVGEVVNLMSVDCQRVQDMMSYTWMVWSIPLQVMIAVYLLWDTLGVSVLAGVGLLFLLLPVNGYLAFRQQQLQKENLKWKDKRLKIMNELINGIKVLKLYAWETSFKDKVLALRKKEIDVLTKVAHQNAFSIFIWTCAPYLVTLATFATYVLSDPEARLDAKKAFVTLSLFNILQFPIAFVPEMISFTAQASVSIKRIEQFLKLGEIDPNIVTRTSISDSAVRIERGLFTWDVKGRSTLHSINLDISDGELVAVVGSVGSGKSSLLSAILGEMERRQGTASVKGSVAYVPQQAWIQNDSVQNNILFGQQSEDKRYQKVLDACALTPDLDVLPGGDQTEIGEKGINLSGGQKQRVSLARAVYANADVYLFDDPLSAVDSHVGKHLFRKVVSDKGVLKHKTRILVTHAVHWLPLVDTIVLMQEGRIIESGSYLQLMSRDGPLAQYLHAVLSSDDTDNDTEDDPEVRELRKSIMDHVESVTSTSEGGTSGDDKGFHRHSARYAIASPTSE
ncbi:hypothetical protein V1264_007667 [Littorina saxatilis]|uniref:ABC-type glutathione-S-conjugate transporter n=1 Tax=Littorina saxatilis TaxID=31220 RepID=A0AAN9AVW8_9CAEN